MKLARIGKIKYLKLSFSPSSKLNNLSLSAKAIEINKELGINNS
jgi:hypothetical protein